MTVRCTSGQVSCIMFDQKQWQCGIWNLSSLTDQELNPGPLHWQHGVLISGPPGKSRDSGSLLRI